MIKRILLLWLYLLLWLGIKSPVWADTPISGASASLSYKNQVKVDPRPKKLVNLLSKYDSPLISYAKKIVALADKYQLDWRLVVAISGIESTFCKAIPYNSYNCWGWENGNHAFQDYDDALETVSKTLRLSYYDKGFDIPETIAPIYAPPSTTWAGKVRYFMSLLEDDTPATFLAKQFSI